MAFLAAVEGRQVIHLGDSVLAEHGPDWKVSWPIALSADGRAVACKLVHARTGKESVAVNGRRGEEFDAVGAPVVSGDGRVAAYRARAGEKSFVVVGGRRGPPFDLMQEPALSPDGCVVAYAAAREGRWRVVAGGREIPVDSEPFQVFVSPDGRRVGWWRMERKAEGGSLARVVVEGEEGEAFNLVGRPVFSPDGRIVAHWAEAGGRIFMVIGGRKVEVAGRLSDPVFSADGKKLGYGARLGREIWWKVVDLP